MVHNHGGRDSLEECRTAAKEWIINYQLGRRNLTPTQWTYLLGLRYNLEKKEQGGTGANQYTEQKPQNGDSAKTSERLADEYGVSKNTVKRAGQFAEAVEELKGDVPSRAAVKAYHPQHPGTGNFDFSISEFW